MRRLANVLIYSNRFDDGWGPAKRHDMDLHCAVDFNSPNPADFDTPHSKWHLMICAGEMMRLILGNLSSKCVFLVVCVVCWLFEIFTGK